MSVAPTFYREIVPGRVPTAVYQARHDRIDQFGSTSGQGLRFGGPQGRGGLHQRPERPGRPTPRTPTGSCRRTRFTWVLGLDFTQFTDTRINVQLFQTHFFDHNPDIADVAQRKRLQPAAQPQVRRQGRGAGLVGRQPEPHDWMLRPRVSWNFEKNWVSHLASISSTGRRMATLVATTPSDRVYTKLRYSF
jgi:hypothetical protein